MLVLSLLSKFLGMYVLKNHHQISLSLLLSQISWSLTHWLKPGAPNSVGWPHCQDVRRMVAKGISFKAPLFTWQKIIQDLLCCWEINKRAILTLIIWLGPGRQRLVFQWLNWLCVLSRFGPVLGVYAPLNSLLSWEMVLLEEKTLFYSIIQIEDGGMKRQPTVNWIRAVWKVSTEP